jgi:hypothetical protein
MATKKYHGSCHCGAVTFEADIDLAKGSGKCNCNYCTKIRSWKAFIKPEAFKLLSGEDNVTEYHGKNPTTQRFFCKTCGVHTYEKGDAEWMGGPFVAIFLGALDDASIDELMSAPVHYSDGRNNNWMNPPADVRNL